MRRSVLLSGAFFLACVLPTVAVFVWILASQPDSSGPALRSASAPGEAAPVIEGGGDAR
jgi:hypothetical protein